VQPGGQPQGRRGGRAAERHQLLKLPGRTITGRRTPSGNPEYY